MPDELAQQITMVHAACEALGVPILTSESYEADDVIGTPGGQGVRGRVRGRDRDNGQGFSFSSSRDGIRRVQYPRDEGTWFDAEGVKEKFRGRA